MKNYELFPLRKNDFFAICFSLNYKRPNFNEIGNILKKFGASGYFLLDLRACNGVTGNRFFKIYFDGNDVDSKIIPIGIEDLDSELMEHCSHFYKDKDTRNMV